MKFKPVFIEATSIDDMWFQLLSALFKKGRRYKITSGSYEGSDRVTFDFVSGFIHHPHDRPLAPRVPESSPLPPPTTDDEINNYFVNYLMNSELEPNEDYRYSTWIVGGRYDMSPGMMIAGTDFLKERPRMLSSVSVPDQLAWVIRHFREKGLGNEHAYIQIGYPESSFAYDIPYSNPNERKTSPCLRGLDFRVVDNQLTTHIIYRSWDLISGWPTNVGGMTLLNEYIAEELGIEPGPISFSCKSLHAYDHAYDYLKQRLGK